MHKNPPSACPSWLKDNIAASSEEAWNHWWHVSKGRGLFQLRQSPRFLVSSARWDTCLQLTQGTANGFYKQGSAWLAIQMICALQRMNLQVLRVCTCYSAAMLQPSGQVIDDEAMNVRDWMEKTPWNWLLNSQPNSLSPAGPKRNLFY